jgi:hypothetical protein
MKDRAKLIGSSGLIFIILVSNPSVAHDEIVLIDWLSVFGGDRPVEKKIRLCRSNLNIHGPECPADYTRNIRPTPDSPALKQRTIRPYFFCSVHFMIGTMYMRDYLIKNML